MQFIVHLCIFLKVLRELKGASDYLQGVNCDLVRALVIIQAVIDHFRDLRETSEESFHEIWEESVLIAEENSLSVDGDDVVPSRAVGARVKRLPRRFQQFIITDEMGAELRRQVFIPVLERTLGELAKRFEGTHHCCGELVA